MRVHLPDVNVLIALHESAHEGHERAHQWFAATGHLSWATCPLTENGFIRILSQPSFPNNVGTPGAALAYLEQMQSTYRATHHFWADHLSLTDRTVFQPRFIAGPRQITDIYLLGLCQRSGGMLVTFDRAISTAALVAPDPDLILLL